MNLIYLGTLLESRSERKWSLFPRHLSHILTAVREIFKRYSKSFDNESFKYSSVKVSETHRFHFNLKHSTLKVETSCLPEKGHIEIIDILCLHQIVGVNKEEVNKPHLLNRLLLPTFLIYFLPNCNEN